MDGRLKPNLMPECSGSRRPVGGDVALPLRAGGLRPVEPVLVLDLRLIQAERGRQTRRLLDGVGRLDLHEIAQVQARARGEHERHEQQTDDVDVVTSGERAEEFHP